MNILIEIQLRYGVFLVQAMQSIFSNELTLIDNLFSLEYLAAAQNRSFKYFNNTKKT